VARSSRFSEIADNEVSLKKITNKLSSLNRDQGEATQRVQALLKKHEWIAEEKHFFGKKHTDYDFEKTNPKVYSDSVFWLDQR